jgi:transposase-like protein
LCRPFNDLGSTPLRWKSVNTDKTPTYTVALTELKKAGKCPQAIEHWQVKYLANVVEADHGKLKQLDTSENPPI